MQSLGSHFCAEAEGNLEDSFAQFKLFFISVFSGGAHMNYIFLANILFYYYYIYFSSNSGC